MTIKKLLKQQVCCVKFLLELNLVIIYILRKKNRKTNSLIYYSNNCLVDNYDDWQQLLL